MLLPLALQKIENEYLLFGVAGLVSLVAFVGLILVPALGSYGRIWEKAAAGLLSLFVLVALILIGVVARPRDRLLLHRRSPTSSTASPAGDNERDARSLKGQKSPAKHEEPGLLDALAEAVESGAGLPAMARAAAKVLDASVALIDRSSAVLAVAGASLGPGEEAARRAARA